jgi:hypothetical protein
VLRLCRKNDVGDDMAGYRKLIPLEPVNQKRGDISRPGRRDSHPDSMLLAYKG